MVVTYNKNYLLFKYFLNEKLEKHERQEPQSKVNK